MKTVELMPEAFLEAGGRISLAEWAELDDEERLALADAGAKLRQTAAREAVEMLVEVVARSIDGAKLRELARKAAREAAR